MSHINTDPSGSPTLRQIALLPGTKTWPLSRSSILSQSTGTFFWIHSP